MPTSNKKAQVTVSEQKVNCTQPQERPVKRAKKSKISTNAEPACPSFSRSLLYTDISKENQISVEVPRSTDESVLSNSEGTGADVARNKAAFKGTMARLFGPYATVQIKPRRCWDLDTHHALFGPEGQTMMMSDSPRHYDIFEPFRNRRMRPRKQPVDDTQNELFGYTMPSSTSASPTSVKVSHDLESSDSESTRQKFKYFDVFEPYRGMKRRRQRPRREAADTHGQLFAQAPAQTVRKPVKNPARFTKKTPKITEDVVYDCIQPLVRGDNPPPLKTGKACFKSGNQPRNPVTGSGFPAVSRNSVVMPDRPRMLKEAAEGVTVADPHERNPVTGDGMPMPLPDSITDPTGRQQRRTTPDCGAFRSQFVIADDQGPPATDGDAASTKRVERKRPSHAHDRMFNRHAAFGIGHDAVDPPELKHGVVNQQPTSDPSEETRRPGKRSGKPQSTEKKSTSVDEPQEMHVRRVSRRRRVQPTYAERPKVLAWSKALGNVDDDSYYIGEQPAKRLADARESVSPITGQIIAGSELANGDRPPTHGASCGPVEDVAADGGTSPADDCNYHDGFHGDDDDDNDVDDDDNDDLGEVGEDGDTADH